MEQSGQIENILSQIMNLDYDSRMHLAELLIEQLKSTQKKSRDAPVSLIELNRLGSEIWNNVNIDKYVQQERKWD